MSKKQINALIDDGVYLGDEYIEESQIPEGSVSRLHNGVWKHLLVKSDGKFSFPVIDTVPYDGISPSDLSDALEDEHSANFFCKKEHPAKKWAIRGLWIFIGVALFVLFLMYMTQGH